MNFTIHIPFWIITHLGCFVAGVFVGFCVAASAMLPRW